LQFVPESVSRRRRKNGSDQKALHVTALRPVENRGLGDPTKRPVERCG
jgi:hypothetical protein